MEGTPQFQHLLTCPGNAGMMSRLLKVGPGTRDKMWGLPGVRLGLRYRKRGWIPCAQGPAQVLSEAGSRWRTLEKKV